MDFTESDFFLDIKDVQLGTEIGAGQFSKVYVGKYFSDYVAVKIQNLQGKTLDTYIIR